MFRFDKKIIISILFLFFVFISGYLADSFLNSAILNSASSITGSFNRSLSTVSNLTLNLFTIFNIIKERDDLRLGKYNSDYYRAQVDILSLENSRLRDQLDLSNKTKQELIEADIDIIIRENSKKQIIINKGRLDRVEVNDAVIVPGNVLAGQVSEVFDRYSRVILINDPLFSASVRIIDRDIIGDLKKTSENLPIVDLIKTDENLTIGDTVVTSGIDNLPSGLIIGSVADIKNNDGALFKSVQVKTDFDNFELPQVFIVKSR